MQVCNTVSSNATVAHWTQYWTIFKGCNVVSDIFFRQMGASFHAGRWRIKRAPAFDIALCLPEATAFRAHTAEAAGKYGQRGNASKHMPALTPRRSNVGSLLFRF